MDIEFLCHIGGFLAVQGNSVPPECCSTESSRMGRVVELFALPSPSIWRDAVLGDSHLNFTCSDILGTDGCLRLVRVLSVLSRRGTSRACDCKGGCPKNVIRARGFRYRDNFVDFPYL